MRALYIHIPFCEHICSYCDFCKYFYNEEQINIYLQDLQKEIDTYYQNDTVKTIYIGGGTPSCLTLEQLNQLFTILRKIKKSNHLEFTIECNIENLTKEKIDFFYQSGVNRLSIGVQSFQKENLSFLERNHTLEEVKQKIKYAKKIGFKNINVDLIYALPCENKEMLLKDLKQIFSLEVSHISTYSLMIEPHTKLFLKNIEPIDEDKDYAMYQLILKEMRKHGYMHYEFSNFCKQGYESNHNLTYWDNEEYYGFGVGASGYINKIRYENTKNLKKYHKGIYKIEENKISYKEDLENTFILGLRKIKGISKNKFYQKYQKDIHEINLVNKLLQENQLQENEEYIFLNQDYIYTSNRILYLFLDGCIDE